MSSGSPNPAAANPAAANPAAANPAAANPAAANPAPANPGAANAGAPDYADQEEYVLWAKYEDVAMHFNELIIRLRTQALGGLTAIVALSSVAINFAQKPITAAQWDLLFGTMIFFLAAWTALWILDKWYYDLLLQGAVNAILAQEKKTVTPVGADPNKDRSNMRINLSTLIRDAVPYHYLTVYAYYSIVWLALAGGIWFTWYHGTIWQAKTPEATEYKVKLDSPVEVKIHPDDLKIHLAHPDDLKVRITHPDELKLRVMHPDELKIRVAQPEKTENKK